MDKIAEEKHNFEHMQRPGRYSTKSNIPRTPLIRGARNYFPDGVKMKRIDLSGPIRNPSACLRSMGLLDASPRDSAPLHVLWPPTTAQPRIRDWNHSSTSFSKYNESQEGFRPHGLPATACADICRQTSLGPVVPVNHRAREEVVYTQRADMMTIRADRTKNSRQQKSKPLVIERETTNSSMSSFYSDRSEASTKSIDSSPRLYHSSTPKTASSTDSVSSVPSTACSDGNTRLGYKAIVRNHECGDSQTDFDENARLGFQVHVRLRPLEDQECGTSGNRLRSTTVKDGKVVVLCTRPSAKKENNGNKHSFHFDSVLDESSTQKDVYDVTTHPLVEMMLKGHHTCIVTYGSPGTGKSHALFGKASSGKHKGIIIRATESILTTLDKLPNTATLTMSFLQLYNEKFYDILDSSATDSIRFHDTSDSPTLNGITELPVRNIDDVTKQLRRNPNRLRDAGRSHTIFTLYFRKEEQDDGDEGSKPIRVRTTVGKFDFVDLVGVSRSTKHSTHDSGNNATAKANKSLKVFSKVIQSLTDPENHQPSLFRDSKLTRLLKEPLGGNCATRLLVAASPCPNSAHETLVCLQFASLAMMVKNEPVPQVDERIIEEETLVLEEESSDDLEEAGLSSNYSPDDTSSQVIDHQPSYTGSLPPINARSSFVCGTNLIDGEFATTSTSEANTSLENSRSRKGSVSKSGRSSQEDDFKTTEKRSKRRNKAKPSDSTTNTRKSDDSKEKSALYWQINGASGELLNGGQVVSLPHITSPDREISMYDLGRRVSVKGNGSPSRDTKVKHQLDNMYARTPTPPKESIKSLTSTKPPTGSKDTDRKEAFAASLMPAAFDVINSRGEMDDMRSSKQLHMNGSASPSASDVMRQTTLNSDKKSCCLKCAEREEQIKANYDHLIMFSKKDRDLKQLKIEELERKLLDTKENDVVVQLQRLNQEHSNKMQTMENLRLELCKSEELIENYKNKLSTMVSLFEIESLQEVRRTETALMEKQRNEIESLKINLGEQTKGATRMLEVKSEQNRLLDEEVTKLKEEMKEKEREAKIAFDQWQADLTKSNLERDRLTVTYESAARETSSKLESAAIEIEKLKQLHEKKEKETKTKQDVLQRELSAVMLKFAASKQEVEKLTNQKPPTTSHSSRRKSIVQVGTDAATNTEDVMKEKLNGLAYSIQCLKCAAKCALANGELKDSPDMRDAEMRILLFQDTKNREILVQLKRERDLLRDVMKIMYCRQWFTEEGKSHVKRTLRRVGIDVRELDVLKKKAAT